MKNFNKELFFKFNKIKRDIFINSVNSNIDKYEKCIMKVNINVDFETLFAFINTILQGKFFITSKIKDYSKLKECRLDIIYEKSSNNYKMIISDDLLIFEYDKKDIIKINSLKEIGIVKSIRKE